MENLEITIKKQNCLYPVYISDAPEEWSELLRKTDWSRCFIISDSIVSDLYLNTIVTILENAGKQTDTIILPSGEKSKDLKSLTYIYDHLLEMECSRNMAIIALGGGVIGDLSGFVASTFKRGITLIHIPTTLLSQVDSCLGGKTAINHPAAKNVIGTYYHPSSVFISPNFLTTLEDKIFTAGLGEIIKYAILEGGDFFSLVSSNSKKIDKFNTQLLKELILKSIKIKAAYFQLDEKDQGIRNLLNLGHTVGHAIEAFDQYTNYNHGEAVALGIKYTALLSNRLNFCSAETLEKTLQLLSRLNLNLDFPEISAPELHSFVINDKKIKEKKVNFIFIKELGKAVAEPIEIDMLVPPSLLIK